MINWFDMPAEGLSNGGQFEVKELEVTENGTYETKGEMYNKVTVNVEGGGGSWQTVFEGSVVVDTYMEELNVYSGYVSNTQINGDSIKVTLNGVEYMLPKTEYGYGAIYDDKPDLSEYPIYIATGEEATTLLAQTAGTYSLKIEEPQSGGGGSSDFSTAEVDVTVNGEGSFWINNALEISDEQLRAAIGFETDTYTLVLYKGVFEGVILPSDGYNIVDATGTGGVAVSTAALGKKAVNITGDGTLTVGVTRK